MPRAAGGPALGTDLLEQAEGRGHHGHEGRGRAHGQAHERQLHPAHALGAAVRLDLLGVGVVVGHEEVLAHGVHLRRVRHAQRGRGVHHAVQAAREAVAVGIAQDDAALLHEVAVLGMTQAAGQDPHVGGPEVAEDALEQDRAPQGVGVPRPLGEDVRAAAADGRGPAPQSRVGGVGLAEQGQVRGRETLAEDGRELRRHRRRARSLGRAHEHRRGPGHGCRPRPGGATPAC